MKKLLILAIPALLFTASCEKEDNLTEIENRLAAAEGNVTALQDSVASLTDGSNNTTSAEPINTTLKLNFDGTGTNLQPFTYAFSDYSTFFNSYNGYSLVNDNLNISIYRDNSIAEGVNRSRTDINITIEDYGLATADTTIRLFSTYEGTYDGSPFFIRPSIFFRNFGVSPIKLNSLSVNTTTGNVTIDVEAVTDRGDSLYIDFSGVLTEYAKLDR